MDLLSFEYYNQRRQELIQQGKRPFRAVICRQCNLPFPVIESQYNNNITRCNCGEWVSGTEIMAAHESPSISVPLSQLFIKVNEGD